MGSELKGVKKTGMSTDKCRRKRFYNGERQEKYAESGLLDSWDFKIRRLCIGWYNLGRLHERGSICSEFRKMKVKRAIEHGD